MDSLTLDYLKDRYIEKQARFGHFETIKGQVIKLLGAMAPMVIAVQLGSFNDKRTRYIYSTLCK